MPRISALILTGLVALGALTFLPDMALAQSNANVQSRLDRLERELQTLSRALFRDEEIPQDVRQAAQSPAQQGGAELNERFASLDVRLNQLEMEIRSLTGQMERLGHQVNQLNGRLDRVVNDLQIRLDILEEQTGQPQARRSASVESRELDQKSGTETPKRDTASLPRRLVPEPADSALSPAPADSDSEQLGRLSLNDAAEEADTPAALYQRAFAELRDGAYEQAKASFQTFLNRHPEHDLADNARYWLGESYYVQENYERAARNFAQAYQKNPDGPKAVDNLLKLGLSLAAMDKDADACVALRQLENRFPDASAPIRRRTRQEQEGLGCAGLLQETQNQ